MERILLFVIGACGLASANNVAVHDCGSAGGVIKAIDVMPCPAEPCTLKRNTNLTVAVTFESNELSAIAQTRVFGIIAGFPIPFLAVPGDACSAGNVKCPILARTAAVYKGQVSVLAQYPKIRLTVKWELLDANDKPIFCFVVPVRITD